MQIKVFILLLLISLSAVAETGTSEETISPWSGFFEVRPSWYCTKGGSWGTEDTAAITYQLNSNTKIGYTQYFLTNLYNPTDDPASSGLNLRGDDGFAKIALENLWKGPDERTSLSYQGRIYLPTYTPSRDKGLVTFNRNYFTLTHKASDTVTFKFMEIPILHFYSHAGAIIEDSASANLFFENRIYLISDINLTEKLSLSLNLMFHQNRYRDFQEGAKNNASWAFVVWTYPELTYALTETVSLGLAFYSDNLVKPDLSSFDIAGGLEKGVAQLVFGANI